MSTTAVPAPPEWLPAVQVDVLWQERWHSARPLTSLRSPLPHDEVAERLQEVQRARAMLAAEEAELILDLAAARPASGDPRPGTPGAAAAGWSGGELDGGSSEFLPAELSVILNLGRGTATIRLSRALTWRDKLPGTFDRLRAGLLDERRAQTFADELAHTPAHIAARIEAELLGAAGDLSVYRLRERITALVVQLDSEAAEKARRLAEKNADVHLYPSGVAGRSTLAADLPTDEAVECHDLIDQLARMLKADGDARPIGALRAHVLSALIRRPADHGLPAVDARLTVTAALTALEGPGTSSGEASGEVNGAHITAAHLRELLVRLGALGLTAPSGARCPMRSPGPTGSCWPP